MQKDIRKREIIGVTDRGWEIFHQYEAYNSRTKTKYLVTEAYDENGYERVLNCVVSRGPNGCRSLVWPDAKDQYTENTSPNGERRWARDDSFGRQSRYTI